MIIIADEDERKDIDVCEGAIGWLSKQAGLEVLHLYEEAVNMSGLRFRPMPICDSAYYVDAFDKYLFINLGCYFGVVQKNKMTELANIAHSLGAKKCELQTYELEKTISINKGSKGAKVSKGKAKGGGSLESSSSSTVSAERKILFTQTFEGEATPERPKLCWYAHDTEIKRLIDTRCSGDYCNTTRNYRIEIDNSASSTMSLKMASKINFALKRFGASCNFSFEGEVQKESRQMLLFDVEF